MRLAIGLATRGRPELLARTIETTLENRRLKGAFVILLDHDDPEPFEVAKSFAPDVFPYPHPREDTLGGKYNRLMLFPADVYLTMVDYAPHLTPGFDEMIVEAASLHEDGIGVVYNRYANLSFPGINAVTRGLAERMGFLYPPYFPYWFVDHWLDDVASMIERVAFADVRLDFTKRPGTMECREPGFWASLFDATRQTRKRQARAIIEDPAFCETEGRKRLLRNRIDLVEDHSTKVNTAVHAMQGQGPEPAQDERYRRTKTNAIQMMISLLPDILADWRAALAQRGETMPLTHPDPVTQSLIAALEEQRDHAMIAAATARSEAAQAIDHIQRMQGELAAIRAKAIAAAEGLRLIEGGQAAAE